MIRLIVILFYVCLILYAYGLVINYLHVGIFVIGLVDVKYRAMIVSIQFFLVNVKYA